MTQHPSDHRRRARRRAAMTLIEIMVVVVIMTILAAAVGINVLNSLRDARIKDARTRARTIQTAAIAHAIDGSEDCPTVDGLGDKLDPTTDHNDPWGHAYRIACEGTTIHVASAGPDGDFDTEDDVGF